MASFGELVISNMHLSPREEKLFIFRIKCLLYDFSKLVLFLIFFGVLHRLDYFLFSYVVLLPLRRSSGGLHFKHYLSCLAFSFCFFMTVTLLAPVKLPYFLVWAFLAVCAAVAYIIGPIQAPTRPALKQEEILARRKYTLAAMAYAMVLIGIFYHSALGSVGYWTILLQTLQLVIAYIKKKGGETYAEKPV